MGVRFDSSPFVQLQKNVRSRATRSLPSEWIQSPPSLRFGMHLVKTRLRTGVPCSPAFHADSRAGGSKSSGKREGGWGSESNQNSESSVDEAECVGARKSAKKVPAKGAGKDTGKAAGNSAGKGAKKGAGKGVKKGIGKARK